MDYLSGKWSPESTIKKLIHHITRNISEMVLPTKRQQLKKIQCMDYKKNKYTISPEIYQKWYCQQKGNNWKNFDTWITKNYLLNVIKPIKEIEAIKMTLVNIKDNFKEQTQNWRNNWSVSVNADSQKLLPLK